MATALKRACDWAKHGLLGEPLFKGLIEEAASEPPRQIRRYPTAEHTGCVSREHSPAYCPTLRRRTQLDSYWRMLDLIAALERGDASLR